MLGEMKLKVILNNFEKIEAGGAFFIFHQITDELN